MAAGNIPIQNLYYLFCYAWDQFPDGKAIEAGLVDSPNCLDLFAHILIRGTRRLLRRGLDRGYLEFSDDLRTVRGRIDLNQTVRQNLLIQNQVHCRFDDLNYDVLHNQIIKTTLRLLAKNRDLNKDLAEQLLEIHRELRPVSEIRLTSQTFGRVRITRDRAQYNLILRVCELLHHIHLPSPGGTETKFQDILSNEIRMSKVFESFIRNFLRHEQTEFRSVGSEVIKWDLMAEEAAFDRYLPDMRTDVTLRSSDRTIVIDAKYYKQTLSNYRAEKVYSSHLYQLFSYLSNMECLSDADRCADGVLIYPVVGQRLDLRYAGRGHKLRVFTLNLDQDWQTIRENLLSLVQ